MAFGFKLQIKNMQKQHFKLNAAKVHNFFKCDLNILTVLVLQIQKKNKKSDKGLSPNTFYYLILLNFSDALIIS